MKGKRLARTLTVCLAVIVGGSAVVAVDSPETLRKIERKRRFDRRGVTQRWDEYRRNYRDYRNVPLLKERGAVTSAALSPAAVDDLRTGASQLAVLDADTMPSPGVVIGITSYDAQAHYAIGRQVTSNPGSETVHFCWTMWDIIPTGAEEIYRYVNYNSWDVPSGTTNQGFNGVSVSLGEFARGGFCRGDVDGNNFFHVALHQRLEEDFPYSTWYLEFPIEGSSMHLDVELTKPALYPDEVEMLWPDIAVEQNGGAKDNTTDIVHVIAMGVEDSWGDYVELSEHLWYYRFDRGDLIFEWEGPVLIDSTRILSYTIDADDNSNTVCIAFMSDYSTDGFGGLNNVAYRESYTSGVGWLTGVELGEMNKNFATGYSDPDGPQAWTETSVAYDHSGDLHILFTEQRVANGSEHVALKHWSKSRRTARTVQIAYYDNPGTWARTLNLGHISLGVGDGMTACKGGAESNEDYLYAIYTKLGGETSEERWDMSQLGYSNGELWLTGSNSNGNTWAPPINLTNTKFPECTSRHPDSVCTSEAWPSIARDVSDIEIFYIYDFEAGAFDEAPWTMNRAMYLNLPGGTLDAEYVCPLIGPNFASYISSDPVCEYHADPGGVNLETLTILNLGNDDMNGDITVTAGGAWLSVDGTLAYAISAGGADIVRGVTMDASALSQGLYVGMIEVTHDDISKTSPREYPIEFFVVTDFKCLQDLVLKTAVASPGVLSLEVGSNSRLASQNDEGGLWRFVDSSSTIFDATLLLAYGPQPTETGDTIVFHRFYERDDPGQGGLRAVTDLVVDTSHYGTGTGYAKASSELHTHAEGLSPDSVLAAKVEWFFPQDPIYADFVIAKYTVWNRTGSPVSDVAVALWADLDVIEAAHMDDLQQGVGNHGNYVQGQNLIYQYGYDKVDHVPSNHLESAQRYSGGVSYLAGRDATGAPFKLVPAPIRGAVGDNRDNTAPERPNSRFFYRTIVGGPGVSIWEPAHADPEKDAYTWIQLDHGRTLDANGANAEQYFVAWVSDTLQHDDYFMWPKLAGGLEEVVDSAWAWADRNAFCQCLYHCDPEPDGVTNALDVCYVIGTAFMGWSQVFDDDCPYARTDVDCSGWTNVLDVAAMVNVAYRGLDPATQFCDGCGTGVARIVSQAMKTVQVPDVSPGNFLMVESKEVLPDETDVEIGIYIENDDYLSSMTLPLEFRSVSNDAYFTSVFTLSINPSGRLAASSLTEWATLLYSNTPSVQSCSGPTSSTWSGGSTTPNADGSPDAVMWAGVAGVGPMLPPGSDGAPGSGDASLLLTFDVNSNLGEFEIDTCCMTPANHLGFVTDACTGITPAFMKGIVSVAPGIMQCTRTSTDPYLLTCPRGDILFNVHLRDSYGNPVEGYDDVYLDFSDCDTSELTPQPGAYPYWPIIATPAPSNANGTIQFAIAAGGNCADCEVTVHTGCGFSRTVPVRSVDVNGDGCVLPNDWDEGLGMCRDLNADGVVDDVDMIRHEAHCCDHCFPAGPGDWLGQHLSLLPDGGFEPDDTLTICWSVDNNDPSAVGSADKTLGAYLIDSLQLFIAPQEVDPTWEWLTSEMYAVMLPTGTSLYDSVECIAPEYRDLCIQARLYSDCSDTALVEKICSSVERQCPPAALAFEFYTRRLSDADEYILSWSDPALLALGWNYYFNPDTIIPVVSPEPVSFTEIQASDLSDPGTSGALTIYYRIGTMWDQFTYRVLQDYYVGDLCGGANRAPDCEVNVVDVVCLVDYIFRSGPPPDPVEHADMNLDGVHNVLDVVTLVDYVFRGGDPPPDPHGGPRR